MLKFLWELLQETTSERATSSGKDKNTWPPHLSSQVNNAQETPTGPSGGDFSTSLTTDTFITSPSQSPLALSWDSRQALKEGIGRGLIGGKDGDVNSLDLCNTVYENENRSRDKERSFTFKSRNGINGGRDGNNGGNNYDSTFWLCSRYLDETMCSDKEVAQTLRFLAGWHSLQPLVASRPDHRS